MSIKDYSKIENFNIAANDAVVEGFKVEDMVDDVVSVVYKYKGRVLKATAEVELTGLYLDDKPIVRSVSILNVETVKGE